MNPLISAPAEIPRNRILSTISPAGGLPARLTLMFAPYGYGKTTALRQWISEVSGQKLSVHYVCLRPDMSEAQFWNLLSDTLAPENGNTDVPLSFEDGAVQIGAQPLQDNTVLVIDDFEYISNPSVERKLAELLDAWPQLFLVASGSRFTSLNSPFISARMQTETIDENQLAFDETELDWVSDLGGVSHARAEHLAVKSMSGWPLGISLALREDSANHPAVSAYHATAEQIYSLVPSALAGQVLSLLALFPGAPDGVLSEAVGVNELAVKEILEELWTVGLVQKDNSFVYPVYRTLPYMDDFLRGIASRHWTQAEISSYGGTVAQFVAAEDPLSALRLHLANEDYRRAEDLVLKNMLSFVELGSETLLLLKTVPAWERSKHPYLAGTRLLLEMNHSDMSADFIDVLASEVREQAQQCVEASAVVSPIAAQSFLILAERRLGQWNVAMSLSQDLFERLKTMEGECSPLEAGLAAVAYGTVGQTALLSRQFALSEHAYGKLAEIARLNESAVLAANALSLVALSRYFLGKFDLARSDLRAAGQFLSSGSPASGVEASADYQMVRAVLADKSKTTAKSELAGYQLTGTGGTADRWPFLIAAEVTSVFREDGAFAALKTLGSRINSLPSLNLFSPLFLKNLIAEFADLATVAGDYILAEQILRLLPAGDRCRRTSLARWHLYQGQYADAVELLTPAVLTEETSVAEQGRLLLLALAEYAGGNEKVGLSLFSHYVRLANGERGAVWPGNVPHALFHQLCLVASRTGNILLPQPERSKSPVVRPSGNIQLSETELKILSMLPTELSIAEIAKNNSRSENTVKAHIRSIYKKLGVDTRSRAVAAAARLGIFESPSEVTGAARRLAAVLDSRRLLS